MARIPEDELERLKRDVSVKCLAETRGVKLAPHGDNLIGLCPFHDDKEPSLVISPKKNLWHCLGACGKGGSVVDWVMQAEGVSFRHAVEILRADNPSLAAEPVPPPKRSSVPKLPIPFDTEASDAEVMSQVVDYYHETLKQSPEALEYLESRGLLSDEVISRFRLGFANRTLGYRLPQKTRKEGQVIRERLQNLGVLRTSGHEHLNGSVVVPIFDNKGSVAQLYGRKVTPNLRAGTPKHLYLNGPRRGIWNLAALRESREIILCEALVDALTFWRHGYHHVTTAYGTNGFTDEMLEAMKSYGTERVLLAFDRDDAGDQAAEKLAERLGSEGISCFRVLFPRGMDANDYALKVSPSAQSLGVVLRAAQHIAGPFGTSAPKKPTNHRQITKEKPSSSLAAAKESSALVKTKEITASPVPPVPAPDVPTEIRDHEVLIALGDRKWRVRGLARNLSYEVLKVNLLVAKGEHFHVDSLDLYSARQRGSFLKQAVEELQVETEVLKKDLGKVLLKLEELQEFEIKKQLEPDEEVITLSTEDKNLALALLKRADLLDQISEAFATCGLVGEDTNKLVGYLAAVSRKLTKPLAVMVQSSSAAGKSALMEAVLAFVPEEERVQYSAMTGQSLFYMGETDLQHKVLAIAEEEGAERASYALKLLQSEGKLSIASTGKDPSSGRLVTHEYHVEGPAAILLTTTAIDLDEELLNRCVVLAVDESREQTRAIHQLQRESRTLEGLEHRLARQDTVKLHQNAQRLLRPLFVVNPFARHLTFLDDTTRTRRDHEKYLGLIDALTLLHQHQREVKTGVVRGRRVDYVEATLEDIDKANQLASEALGRTLDELPPQSRRFLELLNGLVAARCEAEKIDASDIRFTRREVLNHTRWSYPQVRRHLDRLVEHEYLLVHRGQRGQSFVYELLWHGEGVEGEPFVMGLIPTEKLQEANATTSTLTPETKSFDPSLTPHCPPFDPPLTGEPNAAAKEEKPRNSSSKPKNAHQAPPPRPTSYPHNEPTVVMQAAGIHD